MAQLIVRNLDDRVVARLKALAQAHHRSAEAEHREILTQALLPASAPQDFVAFLGTMPDNGDDGLFAIERDLPRDIEL